MNTLHVFGDSFTESVKTLHELSIDCLRIDYSKKIYNLDYYPVWSELLAEKLGFQHKNYASSGGVGFDILGRGNSNNCILYNLNEVCNTFKKNDIVIVGFTDTVRFPWPYGDDGDVFNSLPNAPTYFLEKKESDVIDFISVRRNNPFYIEELFQKMKVFERLSEVVGFKLYYWSWITEITEYRYKENLTDKKWIFPNLYPEYGSQYNRILDELGGISITQETIDTDIFIEDAHMGKKANEIQADLFYGYIKNFL